MVRRRAKTTCFDKRYSHTHNCNTASGFRRWIVTLLCTMPKSSQWFGLDCTSWLWLTRHVTKRKRTSIWGDVSVRCVQEANEQIVKVVLLGMLGILIDVGSVFEQPLSSIAPAVPCFSRLLQLLGASKTITWLGCFGASSAKPLQLWHNQDWVRGLRRTIPRGLQLKPLCYKDKHGGWCGHKKRMHASAAYPEEFGKCAADCFIRFLSGE